MPAGPIDRSIRMFSSDVFWEIRHALAWSNRRGVELFLANGAPGEAHIRIGDRFEECVDNHGSYYGTEKLVPRLRTSKISRDEFRIQDAMIRDTVNSFVVELVGMEPMTCFPNARMSGQGLGFAVYSTRNGCHFDLYLYSSGSSIPNFWQMAETSFRSFSCSS